MTPIPAIRPRPFNRAGYIATLRATKIKESDGLSILIFLAEKCADDLSLKKREFTAEVVGRNLGIKRITAIRRMRKLKTQGLLKSAPRRRVSHFQLPTETELQKFA